MYVGSAFKETWHAVVRMYVDVKLTHSACTYTCTIKRSTPITQVLMYTAGRTASDVPTSTRSDTSSSTPNSSPSHVDNKPEGG